MAVFLKDLLKMVYATARVFGNAAPTILTSTKGSTKATKSVDKVYSPGLLAIYTKDTTSTICVTGTAKCTGWTDPTIRACGNEESSMERAR